MKKRLVSFISILTILTMVIGLSACSSSNSTDNLNPANDENKDIQSEISFPEGNIEMIVPYSAGGGTDNAARIIADALSKEIGTKVTVVNKPGGGGEIGFTEIAKSNSDGYTIGVLGSPDNFYLNTIKETEYKNEDFDYLAVYNLSLPVLVAKKDGFKTIEELFEYGKANPGKVTIGASGGGPTIEAALTMSLGDYEATIVNFPGSADVMAAVMGGHIDAGILTPSYLPTTDAEGCVPLVYFSKEKSAAYPDIRTMEELGFDVDMAHNPIFVLPAGVPTEVRTIIANAMSKISKDPEIAKKFEEINTVYKYMENDELNKYLNGINKIIKDITTEYSELFKK